MSEWISVKDRLPERYDTYLIFTKWGIISIMLYDSFGWNQISVGDVLYWMPLPEPPK